MSLDRDQLKSLAMIGTVVALCTAGLALVWLASDFQTSTKVALSGVIVLVYPVVLLVERVIKRGGSAQAGVAAKPAPQLRTERAFPDLERDATVAVNWLREKLGDSGAAEWAYGRPWLVVAGMPASGKTSLLNASGLYFHTLPGETAASHTMAGCNWRVADDAVLLDTAGRYQTESQHDAEEWKGLIQLLRSHRKQRPLDGLLLVVNIAELIAAESHQIEKQAKILRQRLDEAIAVAGHSFPVYLIFAGMDEIEGFNEFFRIFPQPEREQVWGVTFPLNQTTQARDRLEIELDALHQQLLRRRLVRLGVSGEPAEQLSVFNFPAQFRRHHSKLALLMGALFRPNPFSILQPLLRGFYFTASAPRQRDRSQGPVTRIIELETAAPRDGFFIAQLFRQVILGDRHLAASLQTGMNRRYLLQQILAGLAGVLLLFGTVGVIRSFQNNQALIAEGTQAKSELEKVYKSHQNEPSVSAEELRALETARNFLDANEQGRGWFYHFGLYSGESIGKPLRDLYFEVISQRFFKPAAGKAEATLVDFAKDPAKECNNTGGGTLSDDSAKCYGRIYKLLRAYRMLSLADPVNSGLLIESLEPYWRELAPAAEATAAVNHLKFYAGQAVIEESPHRKIDAKLAQDVQTVLLKDYPMPNRYLDAITAPADQKLLSEQETFSAAFRTGWVESTSPVVPGSYTLKGYEMLKPQLEKISPDTVKAEGLNDSIRPSSVSSLYAAEYTRQWERFLSGIKVRPFPKDNTQLQEAFSGLVNSQSAMARSLRRVAEQTGQITPEPSGWWDKIFGATPPAPPKEVVEKFSPLKAFIAEGQTAGLTQYLNALQPLQSKLDEIIRSGGTPTMQNLGQTLWATEGNVEKIIDPLSKNATTQSAAELLRQPLKKLRNLLEGDELTRLKAEWQAFANAVKTMKTQYPFNRSSSTDAPQNEIERLFNPANGVLANIKGFERDLQFEPVTRQWQPKEGKTFPDQDVLNYLNRVAQMQDAFFPNQSPRLSVGYTMKVTSLPVGVVVEINGQKLTAQNQSVPGTWPSSSTTGVVVTQNGAQIPSPDASGPWGIFRLVDRAGGRNLMLGPAQVTVQYNSKADPFDRQLFSQLGDVPTMK